MKLKKLMVVASLAGISSVSMAGGFDGPFVQLGIGGSATSSKTSGDETLANINGTTNSGSFNGLVSAGWSQEIANSGFNLAADLFYVIGNQDAGQNNASYTGSAGFWERQSLNSKLKNTFGIAVEPGWNFTNDTLGYVKLAWVNSRINLSDSYSESNPSNNNSGSWQGTTNGFGYGLGAKHLFTQNIYGAIDLMGVSYSSCSVGQTGSVQPTQFIGFASIGYKF